MRLIDTFLGDPEARSTHHASHAMAVRAAGSTEQIWYMN